MQKHSLSYPNPTPHYTRNSKEEHQVRFSLAIADSEHRHFIDWAEPDCKRGPGDPTGASYAFDLYDFSKGIYHYQI